MKLVSMTSDPPSSPRTQSLLSLFWQMLQIYPLHTILTLIVLRFFFRRYATPLRKYPGPFLASGTRLHALYHIYRGQSHTHFTKLHRRYGPIVRIQPNQLSFASPEAARQVLSPGKGFHKTDFYWVFPPYNNPDIFTEIREDVHATKKRFTNAAYSLASFQALTPWIDTTIGTLCDKLDLFSEGSRLVDLGKYLQYAAFDSLGEVAFSTNFGFLDQGTDVDGVIQLIDDVQVYDSIVGQIPFLDYFLRRNPIWEYLPWTTKLSSNHVTRTALSQMASRKDGTAVVDRRDLLSQLFEAHEKDPAKFSELDVFSVAHGAIFAGSDSTATTMTSFVWHVLSDSNVHERLVREILDAHDRGLLSEIVAWEEAQTCLPYFQACLKEAMRIAPAVGVPIYRKVPPTGAEIEGQFFQGGTEVAVNAWVLHKDQAIFGSDADLYRPERWLVSDGDEKGLERVKRMERFMFQFGGGSHLCIGRNLALLEINKMLPQLFRRYNFELLHPGRPTKKHSSFFMIQEGLEVRLEKRQR